MVLWPNKREIGSERNDRITEHVNKVEKIAVLTMIMVCTIAAICAAVFGHNWALPS